MTQTDHRTTVEAVFREAYALVLANVATRCRDIDVAEEAVQDALVEALRIWPERGIPENPPGWITTVARRRAVDRIRRQKTLARKSEILAGLERSHTKAEAVTSPSVEDDRLRMLFACCARRLGPSGPHRIQAEIAACHATAMSAADTDWPHIVSLYDDLVAILPSPVIRHNRAVALSQAGRVEEGLGALDELAQDLSGYHAFHRARSELLTHSGDDPGARAELEKALALTENESERRFLEAKMA